MEQRRGAERSHAEGFAEVRKALHVGQPYGLWEASTAGRVQNPGYLLALPRAIHFHLVVRTSNGAVIPICSLEDRDTCTTGPVYANVIDCPAEGFRVDESVAVSHVQQARICRRGQPCGEE